MTSLRTMASAARALADALTEAGHPDLALEGRGRFPATCPTCESAEKQWSNTVVVGVDSETKTITLVGGDK